MTSPQDIHADNNHALLNFSHAWLKFQLRYISQIHFTLRNICESKMLSEYLTLGNVYPTLKFIGVLATGMYTGASVYLGSTHMPSMLAMSDMSQALVQFQYFWPKERHLVTIFSFSVYACIYILYSFYILQYFLFTS